jgi:hypothetical protein
MSFLREFHRTVVLLFIVVLLAPDSLAQQQTLGRVEFPVTTSSEQARAHFLRGVAALHSFWYEEALAEFRAATAADAAFGMGYWGEAMAHNHPLWAEQDTAAARLALEKIKDESGLTPRERAFIAAARMLYGEGDKAARDAAYARAMERVARDFPEDLEAASFYALSLLGTVRPGERGFARQARAGAVALEVYQKNPNHPGAAHYIIHAFDDPEHAVLALPAARRYAEIAPEAHHARHMPSHIFIQLGMWAEAAASNESAWAASEAWVKRRNLSADLRDYHSLHWLAYVYLQQGRYREAEAQLGILRRRMQEPGADPERAAGIYPWVASAYVVETEDWGAADRLFDLPHGNASPSALARESDSGAHAAHGAPPAQPSASAQPPAQSPSGRYATRASFARTMELTTRALALAARGRAAEAEKLLAEASAVRQQFAERGGPLAYRARMIEIRELTAAALAKSSAGKHDEAVALAAEAVALEEEMSPPSGPPELIKPAHELYGEVLLRAGRPAEAARQFASALARQPNRARSLLGSARAHARAGDRAASVEAYAAFLRARARADAQLPELKEARDYLAQSAQR